MNAERNDVDINKLFVWGRVFNVVNSNNEIEADVYMRLLGDADVNKARVYALRKSAELRRKLLDENSDESILYLKTKDEMEIEHLVNYVLMFSMRDITNSAYKEIKVPMPKQPKSDASLEQMEKFQKEVDARPSKIKSSVEKYVKKEVDKLTKLLSSEDKDVLYKKYKDTLVKEFCEQEASRAYRDMEVYLGCYKDDNYKDRFFSSFDEYDNLTTELKLDFRAAYDKLNMPMDELKKLREATQ